MIRQAQLNKENDLSTNGSMHTYMEWMGFGKNNVDPLRVL